MEYWNMWSEMNDKLKLFGQTESIVIRKVREDKIPFSLLKDEFFVKMMIAFSDKVEMVCEREEEIRNAVFANVIDFHPDGIVMNKSLATYMSNDYANSDIGMIRANDEQHMECRLLGVRTVLYENGKEFSPISVLLIRHDEPNPVSRLLVFYPF